MDDFDSRDLHTTPEENPFLHDDARNGSASDAARALFEPPPSPVRRPACPPAVLDVERDDRDVAEVRIRWGSDPLSVVHVPRGGRFTAGPGDAADFVIPESVGRLDVRHDPSGITVEAPDARASVRRGEEETSAPGVLSLGAGESATVVLGPLTVDVTTTRAGKETPRTVDGQAWRPLAFFGATALVGGAFAAVMALTTPPLGLLDDEDAGKNQLYAIQQYLEASAERERELDPTDTGDDGAPSSEPAAEGAEGPEGKMGEPEEPSTEPRRFSTRGQSESPVVKQTREQTLEAAKNFGLIGILAASAPEGLAAPWAEALEGSGDALAMGSMFGDIGAEHGSGGLGLSGPGSGGGARGQWIALDLKGTCIGGVCPGTGGFRPGPSRPMRAHIAKVPKMRPGNTVVSGHIAPEVIQRIVRQNFGRFRHCYEQGLARNPNLEGRVTARFVIDRSGAVATVQSGGADLPDSAVVSCVLGAYRGLSFPAPEDGVVTVSYPILFSPAA